MNHRHLTSLAAGALLLASATVRAQTPPAAPPAGAADPATTPTQGTPPSVETPKPPPPPPAAPAAAPQPVMNTKWKTSLYGFVEMGVVYDTTKSFTDGFQNSTIAREGSDIYENQRLQFNVKNSRIGFNFAAPEYETMKATAQMEADFFGPQAGTSEFNFYGQPSLRMRHFWFKLETPVIDMLFGQFHDLFGWGGGGFYPATVAYLAVSGELYNRRPQIKFSKKIKTDAITVEVAVSAARPFQRDSLVPDFMGGLMLAINDWKGARAQGDGPAGVGSGAIGVSGIYRTFKVNDLPPAPTTPPTVPAPLPTYLKANGWGVAGNLFAPIIPVASADDLSNALTFVAEFSYGQGLADFYNGLSGGARFPPTGPAPAMGMGSPYVANVDGGIVTLNDGEIVPIKWMGALGNLHYHFPFGMGKKMRMSVIGSLLQSDNIVDAHAWLAEGTRNTQIWKKKLYGDANLFYAITPATQISFSGQWAQQTWADDEKSTHIRGEANFHFFF